MATPDHLSADAWSSHAPAYLKTVDRTSSIGAERLITLANSLRTIDAESNVLDNAAGTGAVALHVASANRSTAILATDISQAMLDIIASRNLPNISTALVDAQTLSRDIGTSRFTHAFSTFMLQAITEPVTIVTEMRETLQPGGVIGLGVWGPRLDPLEIWEKAARVIEPDYAMPSPWEDPHVWRSESDLRAAIEQAGFEDVCCEEVSMPFPFESAEAYAKFWLESGNPAPVKILQTWDRGLKESRQAVENIVREDYANGKEVFTSATIGVGRKPLR